uniref:Uncharacterized protein n=1 Tax=Glossina palpalis gambiensis TaxID=67801 RepID=A0A1B0BD39_9MUSC
MIAHLPETRLEDFDRNYQSWNATRNKRTQRKTETPNGGISSLLVKIISVILPITTKQSKRLKRETK